MGSRGAIHHLELWVSDIEGADASLDLEFVGFAIVGLFALTWALAVAVWRFGRIEQRWTPHPADS